MLSEYMESIMDKLEDSSVRKFFTAGGGQMIDGVDANSVVYDGAKGLFYYVGLNKEMRSSTQTDVFDVEIVPVNHMVSIVATMTEQQFDKFMVKLDADGVFQNPEHREKFLSSLESIKRKI